MTDLTCFLGALGKGAAVPPRPLMLDGKPLEEYIEKAVQAHGGPSVKMKIDDSKAAINPEPNLEDVSSRDLHLHLQRLVENPPLGERVKRIGVVFAPRYRPARDFFGLMFDRGVTSPDDQNTFFHHVPREGCAVFLDAIADERTGAAHAQEVLFTTVHELGHVFNLWHQQTPHCFMTRSALLSAPVAPAFYEFPELQQRYLSRFETSEFVWPGGSVFDDRGTLIAELSGADNSPFRGFGLELTVDMDHRVFRPWDPVELEVELGVISGCDRTFHVANALDPSYRTFKIWIEQPNGERRLYRSPNYYCRTRRRLQIRPDRPFHRDISIFGQSGGFTFRHAGVHRVWASLDTGRRGVLLSNKLEIEVLPTLGGEADDVASKYLRQPEVASILYYRTGKPDSRGVRMLEELCKTEPSSVVATFGSYALGRLYLDAARCAASEESSSLSRRGLEHLGRSVSRPGLSRHRRRIAQRLLTEESVPA